MAKTTFVTLKCKALGKREFEISHAERLLNMRLNGGWELADDKYEFKDGSIDRRHKAKTEE
jgi:hypothetical protein